MTHCWNWYCCSFKSADAYVWSSLMWKYESIFKMCWRHSNEIRIVQANFSGTMYHSWDKKSHIFICNIQQRIHSIFHSIGQLTVTVTYWTSHLRHKNSFCSSLTEQLSKHPILRQDKFKHSILEPLIQTPNYWAPHSEAGPCFWGRKEPQTLWGKTGAKTPKGSELLFGQTATEVESRESGGSPCWGISEYCTIWMIRQSHVTADLC